MTKPALLIFLTATSLLQAADAPLNFKRSHAAALRADRARQRDRPAREGASGDRFSSSKKDGKPADIEHATVDTRVAPQGKLVIWLMGYSAPLFERVNSYGLHAIQRALRERLVRQIRQGAARRPTTSSSARSGSKPRRARTSATR